MQCGQDRESEARDAARAGRNGEFPAQVQAVPFIARRARAEQSARFAEGESASVPV